MTVLVLLVAATTIAVGFFAAARMYRTEAAIPVDPVRLGDQPRQLVATRGLTVWWDKMPKNIGVVSQTGGTTNIHPQDYVGPDACRDCHPKNHADWSQHPHRFMNALATAEMVRGDFSGVEIQYRDGVARFESESSDFFMKLRRGETERTYRIDQTIGSRFFQYYVGKLIAGPEPPEHEFYRKDHVLPFGYWLDQQQWVPVVHVGPERVDAERPDPFDPPSSGRHYAPYAASCNGCHTTFPLGDLLGRRPHQMGEHVFVRLNWSVRGYLQDARPEELPAMEQMLKSPPRGAFQSPMADWDASRYAATLGVSCEACHLGGREHVESKGRVPPRFFPASDHLVVEAPAAPDAGRTHDNLNWVCGRCHTGSRPMFAAGISTWNSVEYSDAMRGSCYSQLRCVDCHNPHQAIGQKWSRPPEQDDAVCLKCHAKFTEPAPRLAHTHHPAGSEGDRCLSCHMPRINEGLQDVVRTHTIFSPTQSAMLEANHPNACNLCHTDQPIDWTLGQLKEWYGRTFDKAAVAQNYPDRDAPVALGWLASGNESVRLIAADALARRGDRAAIPRLLDALDDPYMLNRQFALKNLQDFFDIQPGDFGYRFYMSAKERRDPLKALREKEAPGTTPISPPRPASRQHEPVGMDPR